MNLGLTFFRSRPIVVEFVASWLDRRGQHVWDQPEFQSAVDVFVPQRPTFAVQVRQLLLGIRHRW